MPTDPMLAPMLAEPSKTPKPGRASGIWQVEEKYDGWRALVHTAAGGVKLYGGRDGKDYTGQLPALEAELARIIPPDTILDGELVGENWGAVQSAMTSGTPARPGQVVLMVFDLIRLCTRDVRRAPLEERRDALDTGDVFPFDQALYVNLVPLLTPSPASHDTVVQNGGEGTVWKRLGSPYLSGVRSTHWVKYKHEQTDEAVVTGFIPGKGSFKGMVGAIEFEILDHTTRSVTKSTASGMDMDTRKEMTADPAKWLGKLIEVKHNGFMRSGSPRHPQYLRLRSDRPAPATPAAPTRARAARPARAGSWMRNYAAMSDDKLLGCIYAFERGVGEAVDRVRAKDGDLHANEAKALEVAKKRGLL